MTREAPSPASPSTDPVTRCFPWVAGVVLALSLFKGLRMPNLWSATHYTFNYSQGFIRRGLIGEIARRLLGDRAYNYNLFVLGAIIVFALMLGIFVWFIRRTLRAQGATPDTGLRLAILAFVASPGITFFAHIIGYFDDLGLLALLGLILYSARARWRYLIFYLSALLGVFLAFVHEGMVIMFLPTIFFMLLCYLVRHLAQAEVGRGTRWSLYVHTALATLAGIEASSIISRVGSRDSATISALQASIGRVANFSLRGDGFEALYRPVHDNLFTLMPGHWRQPDHMATLLRGFVGIAPGMLFLIYYGLRTIVRWNAGWRVKFLLSASYVVAVLAPLTLNFVGWDSNRWNAISMITAVCCIGIMRLHFAYAASETQIQRWSLPPWALTAGVCAVATGLATTNDLFDGYTVQWFPFGHHLDSIKELFRSHFAWRPPG